ncbi:hypothetical protein L6452_43480 [Arctium lappa]|uniref:Uncharacterized protein n=1 Tax=Arctium lappa TaxID=4217 RepID=A0ACB8XE71_ARCLA|nr:hypothetical protein L6452_43480 [Arctium lappa]
MLYVLTCLCKERNLELLDGNVALVALQWASTKEPLGAVYCSFEGGGSATKGGLYCTDNSYPDMMFCFACTSALVLIAWLYLGECGAALKEATAQTAAQNNAIKRGEIEALRVDAELTIEFNDVISLDKMAREEAASVMEHLHVYECEVKSLKTLTQRVVLTHEEMEEVVLKRCWLARYWSLCVQHGIHAEIAGARYEYWSSFAPLPVEVVIAAGQKAKEENLMVNNDKEQRENILKDANEISGEGSVESMLLVERGLKEMTLLKVEDALAFAMALQRWPNALKSVLTELSKQESDDVLFKQAWLMYFWRRVKVHGLEPDIVDERLQFWMNQGDHPPTSNDAVDVERGLVELRKLGIEAQLWQASRKDMTGDGGTSDCVIPEENVVHINQDISEQNLNVHTNSADDESAEDDRAGDIHHDSSDDDYDDSADPNMMHGRSYHGGMGGTCHRSRLVEGTIHDKNAEIMQESGDVQDVEVVKEFDTSAKENNLQMIVYVDPYIEPTFKKPEVAVIRDADAESSRARTSDHAAAQSEHVIR